MRIQKIMGLILVAVAMNTAAADIKEPRERDAIVSSRLVGTWALHVVNTVTPPFNALQTFHSIGTMTETSDLLAQGGEGPGHGAWQRDGDDYIITFELFIFEPDGTPAGTIRVREKVQLIDDDHLEGFAVADIILPDGTVIENIDASVIKARRVRIAAPRPEELLQPAANSRLANGRRAW